MMGTSLLSMPWAIQQAGFVMGIVLLVTMAGLTLYTCYRVVKSVESVGEYSKRCLYDVCCTVCLDFYNVCKFTY